MLINCAALQPLCSAPMDIVTAILWIISSAICTVQCTNGCPNHWLWRGISVLLGAILMYSWDFHCYSYALNNMQSATACLVRLEFQVLHGTVPIAMSVLC